MVGLYGIALLIVPEGECGRDSPLFFSAAMSQTFIHFAEFGPESGTQTVDEAADLYVKDLIGDGGYQLVTGPGRITDDPAFRILSDDGLLLGGFDVSETQYGRHFVGGHWTCYENFQSFTGST